ncbi:MAG: potassium-transporting ATPase subunit F [Polyangiales bacterium]
MTALLWLGGGLAAALLLYLFVALLFPEKLS